MTKYRVYGSKEIKYYIDVEAADKILAIKKADTSESHLWNGMEDDDMIEPYHVIELEDESVDLSTNV